MINIKKNILITGANGFLGSQLYSFFRNSGENVVGLRRGSIESKKLDSEQIDITDYQTFNQWDYLLRDVDTIIHTAALVHDMKGLSSKSDYDEINTKLTRELALKSISSGVRRFIFISTIKVNGEETFTKPFTADDSAQPQGDYAVSKFNAEKALLEISKTSNLEVVIIRPPLIYGKGMKGNLASLINVLKLHIPLPLGLVKNRRSVVGILNLCDFIKVCIHAPNAKNQIFLVADSEVVSTTDLCKILKQKINSKSWIVPVPRFLMKFLLHCVGKSGHFDRLFSSLELDCTKNKTLLGWEPRFSLPEQLDQAL